MVVFIHRNPLIARELDTAPFSSGIKATNGALNVFSGLEGNIGGESKEIEMVSCALCGAIYGLGVRRIVGEQTHSPIKFWFLEFILKAKSNIVSVIMLDLVRGGKVVDVPVTVGTIVASIDGNNRALCGLITEAQRDLWRYVSIGLGIFKLSDLAGE